MNLTNSLSITPEGRGTKAWAEQFTNQCVRLMNDVFLQLITPFRIFIGVCHVKDFSSIHTMINCISIDSTLNVVIYSILNDL